MKHNLAILRDIYQKANKNLRYVDELDFSDETRIRFVTVRNNALISLTREARRVSLLLWPDTGRPYDGDWAVISRVTKMTVFINSQARCIKFIERSRYSNFYYIIKWPTW